MAKQAALLYEGDNWCSPKALMGIFTNKKDLERSVRKMTRDLLQRRLFDPEDDGIDSKREFISHVCKEVMENGQYRGYDASIVLVCAELNVFEEI